MPRARLDPERQGLDKWEMHKALQNGLHKDTAGKTFHIPETTPGTPQHLAEMIHRHRTVFIKPVNAWGGSGITRIDRIDVSKTSGTSAGSTDSSVGSASALTVYDWHKQGEQHVKLHSIQQAVDRFRQSYIGQSVIVQAGAPLRNLAGRPFDIRVLMQRDSQEKWVYSGAVGRVGGAGSVVSNIALSHGQVMDVNALCRQLKCNREKEQFLLKNLQKAGHAVAHVVEQYRDFFDIGIDLGLSCNNSLWLIEVNTDDALGGPSHELFAKLPDSKLYDKIQKRHMATKDRRGQMLLRELQELF